MATPKRSTARTPAARRARGNAGNPATVAAARDLAEAEQRAKAATTPVAKAATRRVAERKRELYSPEAGRQATALQRNAPRKTAGAAAKKTTRARKTR